MARTEMIEFVKTNGTGAYKVTYKDGTKKNVRLFYSQSYEFICEFKKGSRTRGYYFSLENVAEISKPEAKPENEIFRNNAKRLIKCLTASHLWEDILDWAKVVVAMTDDELNAYKDMIHKEPYKSEKGDGFIGIDAFWRMFDKNSIKTVNYDKYWSFESQVREAIEKGETYNSPRWEKGYDNSVSVKMCEDGKLRGWYSEEFRGTVNGVYYLLIDYKHAIFCERD